jgi:hypothetical protein
MKKIIREVLIWTGAGAAAGIYGSILTFELMFG